MKTITIEQALGKMGWCYDEKKLRKIAGGEAGIGRHWTY